MPRHDERFAGLPYRDGWYLADIGCKYLLMHATQILRRRLCRNTSSDATAIVKYLNFAKSISMAFVARSPELFSNKPEVRRILRNGNLCLDWTVGLFWAVIVPKTIC